MNNVIAGNMYAYILLFITNVRQRSDEMLIATALDGLVGKHRWYIDTGDVDKVLRVEAIADLSREIMDLFTQYGFECKKMI